MQMDKVNSATFRNLPRFSGKKKTQQHPLRGEWCQICSITFMEESQSHYYSNKNYQNLVSKEAESTGHFWSYLHGIFD